MHHPTRKLEPAPNTAQMIVGDPYGKKLLVEFFHYQPSLSLKGGRPTTPPPKSTDAFEAPNFGRDSGKPLFILSCVTSLAENMTAVYTEDTLKAVNKTHLLDPFLKLQDQANSTIDSLMTEMKYIYISLGRPCQR